MHLPCNSHQDRKFVMGWLWFLQVIATQCQGSEAEIHHVDDTLQKGKQSLPAVDGCLAKGRKNSHKPLLVQLVKLGRGDSAFTGANLGNKMNIFSKFSHSKFCSFNASFFLSTLCILMMFKESNFGLVTVVLPRVSHWKSKNLIVAM